ncbi:MAG: TetR/AcrR family transcriptional regulator [Thermoanaerobaculia bacterium]
MGIVERREREKLEVRTKILDAARELFAREGYGAVTMRRIADAIEYSPTAIYLHFRDKETLVRELCEEDFASLARAFLRIAKEPDPLERLRKIGMAYVDFGVEKPNHYRLMFMSTRHEPVEMEGLKKGNPEEDAYAFLVATVAEAISKGSLKPELRDAHVVAQAAWAGVHGVISLHLAKEGDPWVEWRPVKKTAALVVDSMIDGLRRG